MFIRCTSLTEAPELPATTLADYCYTFMFDGCENLTKCPELPATELTLGCYEYMFRGCSKLDTIKVGVMTLDNEFDATLNWVEGIDGPGVFIFPCGSKYDKHGISEVPDSFKIIASPIVIFQNPDSTVLYRDTINCGDTPKYEGKAPEYGDGLVWDGWDKPLEVLDDPDVYYYTAVYKEDTTSVEGNWLCFTAEVPESEIWYYNTNNNPDVQYSIDGGKTWKTLEEGVKVTLKNKDDKVYFKGNNPEGFSHGMVERSGFVMSGLIKASGSVMSLIDGVGKSKVIPNDYCFSLLFAGCRALTQAPELPATTLTKECYMRMFHGCKNLTRAPKLPATKLSDHCYYDMFQATSLVEAPELPATTLENACYAGMFYYCKNLKKAPKLPAKILTRNCYASMFCSCESLEEVPELPATKMVYACYASMFQNCKSIKKAPALPAEELASDCYNHMFSGCSSLTESPVLPATKLEKLCYWGMFEYCTSLKKVTCYAIDMSAENCIKDWLKKVAPEGTMTISPSASWGIGPSGIPEGWSINAVAAKQQWLTE